MAPATSTSSWIIRAIYLYFFATIGLVCTIIGLVMLFNRLLDAYILPDLKAPVAYATVERTADGLALDASLSRDEDGTIASYTWRVDGRIVGTGATLTLPYGVYSSAPTPGVASVTSPQTTEKTTIDHNLELALVDNNGLQSSYTRPVCLLADEAGCSDWVRTYTDVVPGKNEWEVNATRRDIKTSISFLIVGLPLFLYYGWRVRREQHD